MILVRGSVTCVCLPKLVLGNWFTKWRSIGLLRSETTAVSTDLVRDITFEALHLLKVLVRNNLIVIDELLEGTVMWLVDRMLSEIVWQESGPWR